MSGNRITVTDVRNMFVNRLAPAARRIGLDTDLWCLTEGSSTYGNSWKLDMGDRQLGRGWGGNYLGMTAREAWNALECMALAWEIAADHASRVARGEATPPAGE